jgi:predicted molibdopterin-dependent oxidoreductase YjgC
VGSKERLTTPLIRKNGTLTDATWEEAITLVAERLNDIKTTAGSHAIAGIASPRCTNEDNYVFQKFMRAAVGTNNIDTTARTGFAGAQSFIENIFGQGATANIISGLANTYTVMVIGGDPTTINPILGLQIRACARRSGSVLTIGSMEGLRNFNPTKLLPKQQTEQTLLEGIVAALKEKKGLPGSNAALEAKIRDIAVSTDEVAEKTGVSGKHLSVFVDLLANAATFSLVVGKDVVQSTGGSYKLLLLSAINYLANGRIYLLTEKANEQGALDMGCSPDILPGYRPVAFPEFRKKYETVWQTELSDKPGLNLFEMIEAAEKGNLKALYVMGENPLCNIPNSGRVEAALNKLDFLVVQDIFLTEAAKLADVVLPALSWAEKDGTFTNMERRIQRVRKSVQREGMEDWKIISEVAGNMGYSMSYSGAEDVFHELAKVSPLHRDLTYEDVEKGNNIYPYKGEPLRDVKEEIQVDKAIAEHAAGKLYLKVEKPLFHSGTLSTKAASLLNIYPEAVARISSETAKTLSLSEGDVVNIRTTAGSLSLFIAIEKDGDGTLVQISNNFEGKAAFRLTDYTLDPVTKAPCIDSVEITIEKVTA